MDQRDHWLERWITRMKIAGIAACVVAGMLVFAPHSVHAQSGTIEWRKSTPFPEPRADCATGVIDGRLIMAGGTYWEGTKGNWVKKHFSKSAHAFDPGSEQWEQLPDAPTPFSGAASTVIDDRLYVLGGYTGEQESRQILVLAKVGGHFEWSQAGELPDTRLFAWAGAVGKSIYWLGGVRRFEPMDAKGTCCTSATGTSQLMVLNTSSPPSHWEERCPYPGGKRWLFAAATDGKSIWMLGGRDSDTPQQEPIVYDEILEYSITKNTWHARPPLPREVAATAPLTPVYRDGHLLLVSFFKTIWKLDLQTNEYSQETPLPEEAMVDRFFWIDGQLVGAGGENKIESPRRRSEWTFIGRVQGAAP